MQITNLTVTLLRYGVNNLENYKKISKTKSQVKQYLYVFFPAYYYYQTTF